MTTKPVMSITDEQIAEIEALAKDMRWQDFNEFQYTAVCGQAYCLEGDEGNGGVHLLTTFEPIMQDYLQRLSPRSILALISRLRAVEVDAARYRWLREQHWEKSTLCAVARPKDAVKLGHDCPSMGRLDSAIDTAMKGEQQ